MVQPIRNPVDQGFTIVNVQLWRNRVMAERRFCCEDCGGFGVEMHETIVTRGDAHGLPDEKWLRVFSDCNMACLCRACHKKRHGTDDFRGVAWKEACETYGEEAMREWYAGFEFKTPEARFSRDSSEP